MRDVVGWSLQTCVQLLMDCGHVALDNLESVLKHRIKIQLDTVHVTSLE